MIAPHLQVDHPDRSVYPLGNFRSSRVTEVDDGRCSAGARLRTVLALGGFSE